ncbi:MAG TPA: carbohydrate-binding family 9-like protein [Puia sp.]|nr:carbohydrate-binding family 9-like protein [Puia sp.]
MVSAFIGTIQLLTTVLLSAPATVTAYPVVPEPATVTPGPIVPVPSGDTALIRKTSDFTITGKGDAPAWATTSWQIFTKIDSGGRNYTSKSKMLYSAKGIYLLFSGEDDRITTKDYKDDEDIYEGDVFEFFLHTDPGKPPYFEYEINQLGKQLILTLARFPHKNLAWSPWKFEYEKDPLIQRKTVVNSGEKQGVTSGQKQVGAAISGWTAELFFPYELLGLLPGVPPKSGTIWRANFCRIDYDSGKMVQWTWSRKINRSFHDLDKFGTILFE